MTHPAPEPSLDVARRQRALRLLLGFTNNRDFAKALNYAGLSFDTLGDVERGERGLSEDEREAICSFAGVGPHWFDVPLSALGVMSGRARKPERRNGTVEIEARLDELLALARETNGKVDVLAPDPLTATDDARS